MVSVYSEMKTCKSRPSYYLIGIVVYAGLLSLVLGLIFDVEFSVDTSGKNVPSSTLDK